MQVYKALFKVIKKNLPMLMIYVVVFLFFAIFLSNVNTNPLEEDFTETKVNMVFINNDGDSLLAAGLEGYLGQNANFVFIPDESKQLQDALFFKEVEYILKIPKGFTASFLAGSETELTKAAAPGSTSELYLNSLINKYLNNWTIDRLGKTDQAILRLATYEILYTDTPGVVVIDEAIELSKQYSDDKVKNIINAVLDNILKNEVKN